MAIGMVITGCGTLLNALTTRVTMKVRSQAILAWRRRGWNSQGWKP